MIICPHCGKEYSEEIQSEFCPACGGRFDAEGVPPREGPEPTLDFVEGEEIPVFTGEPSEPEREEAYACPWEEREQRGLFPAWWETTKGVLFRPTEFFRQLRPMGRLSDAILFAVIWIVIAAVFQALYNAVFQGAQFAFLRAFEQEGFGGRGDPFALGYLGGSVLGGLICGPIAGLLGLVISAGIYHLVLRLLGGAAYPFEASLRTLAYAQGYNLFAIIPICGGLVGAIYWLVLAIIGLSQVHRCGGGKAAAAVLLPAALCLVCVCGALIAIFAGVGILAQQ